MNTTDEIVSRALQFDIFRNNVTEKLHGLMHTNLANIEETKEFVTHVILSDTSGPAKKKEGDIVSMIKSGLADILSAKKIERFQFVRSDRPLGYYRENFDNLITGALFHQDKITIPFCFDRNATHPVYLNYIKKYNLQKIWRHIYTTESKENKIIFIPFFINGRLVELVKLTGDKDMPMQVKIAEGTKSIFQVADMAIIDKHRDAFPAMHRINYDQKTEKLLSAMKKMHLLVNSDPSKLNINLVANNELKGLLKLIVHENEKFLKMFGRHAIRGTSSTILESFYEQELANLDKKDLPPNVARKASEMYRFVLAICALEIALTTIDANGFLRMFRPGEEIDIKTAYLHLLNKHIKDKLNSLCVDMTVFDESDLDILFEKKVCVHSTADYIYAIRQYHNMVTQRLHETNNQLAADFESYQLKNNLDLFPILDLDNLLGHGPIDGDDMLRKLILGDPGKLHILLFELVPDAPHFWKKIYHCFNNLSDADNTLIAFNETIFDVVVNNYLPSEKKGFHFDDCDEVIIIIDDEEQLQILHTEEFIRFHKNCFEDHKTVFYVSDEKGLIDELKYNKFQNDINVRFDKVNQYVLDKVRVNTDKKPVVLNFSETKLKHLGDKLHELLCTVGDYQGRSILFGYSAPSSFALMKIYNKHMERKTRKAQLSPKSMQQ